MPGDPQPVPGIAARNGRLSACFRGVVGLVLIAYWLSMFTGTHLPRVPAAVGNHNDKLLHFSAYFGLSVLLLSWRGARGPVSWVIVRRTWLLLAAYGVFDELTQPLFDRDAEFLDWVADIFGVSLGLGMTWWVCYRFCRASARPSADCD
jgi:VanZ family protein